MTIHVLIQCSKNKSQFPENNLKWSENTELNSWKEEWVDEEKRFLVINFDQCKTALPYR